MRTSHLIVVLAVALAGVAFWVLLDGDEPAVGDAAVRGLDTGPAADATRVAAPAPVETAAERQDLAPLAAPPPAVEQDPVPASYRRALGGITGRVVEEDGTPVADMTVVLAGADFYQVMQPLDLGDAEGGDFDPVLAEVLTGRDGRFLAEGLETRVIGGVIVDPGGPRALVRVLDQTPSTGELRDIGDIVLPGGVTVRGKVVDERREPLANVRVRVLPMMLPIFPEEIVELRADGALFFEVDEQGIDSITYRPPKALAALERLLPLPTTQTAADGTWELDGVPAGTPLVLFDDTVHVGRAVRPGPTGPAGGELDVGETVLHDGVTLRGQVVDERGDPVPGAQVLAGNRLSLGPVAILRAPITADAEGRFEMGGLRRGLAHAVARREDHDAWAPSEAVTAGEEQAVVRLESGRRLTLALLDPNGEPITGARLTGRGLPDDDAGEVPEFLFPSSSLAPRTRVDEDQRTVIDGLAPAHWDVAVQVDGYALHREVFDLRQGDLAVDVRLKPERVARVRVLAATDGEPVEYAHVAALDAQGFRGFDERPISTARTDADGLAELGGLVDGEVTFAVSHPAYAVVEERASLPLDDPLVIELPHGGRILGQVFENGGAPDEPVMIMLVSDSGADVSQAPRFTLSDLEGKFTFTNVQPGTADIEARERISSIDFASPFDTFFVSELAETEVQVRAGEDSEAVLVLGTGADGVETANLAGRLRVNGLPVQGWHLRTWGQLRRSATTEADGSFDLGLVAAGKLQVMISPPGRNFMNGAMSHAETLELQPGEERWIDIDFDAGRITGLVLDAQTNRPLRGAAVNARAVANEGEGWFSRRQGTTVTDETGRFVIEHLSAATYRVEADLDGYTKAAPEEVEVGPGREPRVELRMRRGWTIAGSIVLQGVESDEPPRWMWLAARDQDGREAAARPTDELHFEFDDLGPGDWEFRLMSSHDEEFAPVNVAVDYERDDLKLVFAPVPPEPPPEETVEVQEG